MKGRIGLSVQSRNTQRKVVNTFCKLPLMRIHTWKRKANNRQNLIWNQIHFILVTERVKKVH